MSVADTSILYCQDCAVETPARIIRAIWEYEDTPLCPVHLKSRKIATNHPGVRLIGEKEHSDSVIKNGLSVFDHTDPALRICERGCGGPRHSGRCKGQKPSVRRIIEPIPERTGRGTVVLRAQDVDDLVSVLDQWWDGLVPLAKVRIFVAREKVEG